MSLVRKFTYQVLVASTALTLSFVAIAGASSLVVRKNIGESFGTAIAQSVSFLKDLSDVSDSLAPSNGQVLTFSGGQWNAASPGSFSENDTLADVTGRGATTTATITATGFIGSGAGLTGLPAPTNGASLTSLPNDILTLNGLSGVTLTTPTNGQILSFNGTDWVNTTPATVTETDPRLPAPGFAGQILQSNNGSAWQAVNTSALSAGNNGQVLKYTHGSGWAAATDNSTDSRLPGSVGASGTLLQSNGSAWVTLTPPACTGTQVLTYSAGAFSCVAKSGDSMGDPVTRAVNTTYTAATDGFVTASVAVGASGDNRTTITGVVGGTNIVIDRASHKAGIWENSGAGVSFVVKAGQTYRVNAVPDLGTISSTSMFFTPFN